MLQAGDFFVDADITRARSLPIRAFRDEAVLAKERETIFRHGWLCLPKASLQSKATGEHESPWEVLALRGNAVRHSFMGEELLLKRGFAPKGAPELLAFPNRCPHAFYPLLLAPTDQTRSRQIHCGQHGLCLNWDGSFVSHPGFGASDPCAAQQLALEPYALAEWLSFLFICRSKPATDFPSWIAPVTAQLQDYPLASLKPGPLDAVQLRLVSGNWKQHAWNYMDSLHVAWIHKKPDGLQDAIDMASYRTEFFPGMSLQWAYAKRPEEGIPQDWLGRRFLDPAAPERRVFALWWLVFPNLTLNFYPWGLSVNIYEPVSPSTTRFTWLHYVADQAKYERRDEVWLSGLVDQEDVMAMDQVQKAIEGAPCPEQRGIFAPRLETGPHWFHRQVYEGMFPER